jgi:anti-sigma regulatory factor (Ser/Thr protein kinase)
MFSHEALLYNGLDGFLAAAVPFLREGLGEPMLVAVSAPKIAALRAALGEDADRIQFEDMAVLGRNPARIIPAWDDFARANSGAVRGIGEPIWAGRTRTELVECQLHESLLNLAFADRERFRLLCPYDVSALDDGVIHEACCSHPLVDGVPSKPYRDAEMLLAPFDSPLPPPPATARMLGFELDSLFEVRRLVEHSAHRAGLSEERWHDLVLAVGELAANSIRHGGGRGILRIWRTDDALICEVRDRGRIEDPLAGRRRPEHEQLGGRGLWIANSVCDLVQVRSNTQGTAVRVHMALTSAPVPVKGTRST